MGPQIFAYIEACLLVIRARCLHLIPLRLHTKKAITEDTKMQ